MAAQQIFEDLLPKVQALADEHPDIQIFRQDLDVTKSTLDQIRELETN